MRKLIEWCQFKGFKLTIDPFRYDNSVTFIFTHSDGFRYMRTITNEDLFMTHTSDNYMCIHLMEEVTAAHYTYIMSPTSDWRDPMEEQV